jgi:agmatine deiminase
VSASERPTGSPREAGYRWPAEWEPHAATWIAWPHAREDWPERFAPIPFVYGEIVRHLAPHEPVHILVQHPKQEAAARALLAGDGIDLERVRFFAWPTDRSWLRDSGPIFLRRPPREGMPGSIAVTDWRFNAWAKYPNWRRDDRIPGRVATELALPVWQPRVGRTRVVLEGGAIDGNGSGCLLATEECLLGEVQPRNPALGREGTERVLAEYLGAERVLWLGRGIVGDDTHGHIDDVARFVAERTIVAASEPDPADANHAILADNLARLRAATDPAGRPFEVVELPMPRPLAYGGQRVPASYLNFYIANGTVLVPTFSDPADRRALTILAGLFPDRSVVGIACTDLIWGLGTLHCLTQQQPAA